ncbi:MAG: response regulator, partial [Pseudoflavonifractor sp.]
MKLNIVVVDDETPICEWLIYCIRKASPDYEVFSASNGEDAYALILERKPNVVFTDIRMPGMDGLELMRRVLELLPFTVFAVLTNYAEFSYAKQALSLGAREYFLKSELRGADIEAFLTSVMERAAAITAQKTQDTLPSGCIDLFNLYQQQEQPGYAGRFWKNQGMAEGMPYGLLCVASSGTTQETWQPPVALCRALTHENSLLYAEVATERGRLYLVLQAPDSRALAALITRAGTGLRRCSGLGVGESSSATGLDCFPALAKQSALAANAFFFGGSDIIRFETLSSRPPLDRQVLRTGKGTILALMAQHRYDQATALTGDWF